MQHNEACTKWPDFHPYDCPECVVLNELEYQLDTKYESLIDDEGQTQYEYGYSDGQKNCETTHEDMLAEEFDKGWDLGYAECVKVNNLEATDA